MALHWHDGPQRHVAPQLQPPSFSLVRKGFVVLVIGVSMGLGAEFVRNGRVLPKPTKRAPLERNGYEISSAAAGTPNIRLNVRLRCAESEKPASCAASVRFSPRVWASAARTRRSHST